MSNAQDKADLFNNYFNSVFKSDDFVKGHSRVTSLLRSTFAFAKALDEVFLD